MTYLDWLGYGVTTALALSIVAVCVIGVTALARVLYRWWRT